MATLTVYGKALDHLADGDIDWTADTIKCSLHTSTYTPAQDTDDFHDDATNEVSHANYTAGGVTLASTTRTYDAGTNKITLDAADVVFGTVGSPVTFTTRYAVIYKDRGGASSADELIGWVDFGGDQTVTAGVFTVTWNSAGIITLTTT